MKLQITAVIILILIVLSGSLSGTLDAMSWPGEGSVLVRNFGANDNGRPVLGMIFNGGAGVLAAENGEVIFSRDKNDIFSRLSSPLGAWTAIDHEDGLISIYSRYDDELSAGAQNAIHVEKTQQIAVPGISGWSQQNGFYFFVFDRRERCWINPAMLITPVQEMRSPQIISVELINDQGSAVQSRNISQGRYTVAVNAVSRAVPTAQRNLAAAAQAAILAPQRIICLVNGAEAGSLNFEAISARDGSLMVFRNGLVPARQVFASYPAMETADIFLTRGQVNLEIIVQDIAGNSSSQILRLIVN